MNRSGRTGGIGPGGWLIFDLVTSGDSPRQQSKLTYLPTAAVHSFVLSFNGRILMLGKRAYGLPHFMDSCLASLTVGVKAHICSIRSLRRLFALGKRGGAVQIDMGPLLGQTTMAAAASRAPRAQLLRRNVEMHQYELCK